jgi:hypothetical protein
LGGGASEASHVPFLPQFTGDECEDRVRIAPAGSIPLRSPLVPPVKDCVPSRHPLGRVHNIADVPANLFSERVGDDDVVDGFSFLVAEEQSSFASSPWRCRRSAVQCRFLSANHSTLRV